MLTGLHSLKRDQNLDGTQMDGPPEAFACPWGVCVNE
jgi:hypothetical protein